MLLAGIDIDKHGAALRLGRYKLLVGAWGSGAWCDLNVSGLSPAYPAPVSPDGLGGEGGLWCASDPPLAQSAVSSPSTSPSTAVGGGGGRGGAETSPSSLVEVPSSLVEVAAAAPPSALGGVGAPSPTPEQAEAAPRPPWWGRVAGLYDVESDPRETHDLQATHPAMVQQMLHRLLQFNSSVVPSVHRPADPAGREHADRTNCWGPWR